MSRALRTRAADTRRSRVATRVPARCVRALIQRVTRASVTVDGEVIGAIDAGLLVLVGVTHTDDAATRDAASRRRSRTCGCSTTMTAR